MSQKKFIVIVAVLLCNLAALLLLAWVGYQKLRTEPNRPMIGIQLGPVCAQKGIELIEWAKDGATEPANIGGSDCRVVKSPPGKRSYMYFAIAPSFKRAPLMDALVTVEYFDNVAGEFRLNYDALDLVENKPSQYETARDKQKSVGSQSWQKAHFVAHDAQFKNSQNGGADFRLEVRQPELYVRRVTIEPLSERPK